MKSLLLHVDQLHAALTETVRVFGADVQSAGVMLQERLQHGGKAVVFGNGGSAAQASHFAGELVGRYQSTRRPYAALALGMDAGVTTCIGNDFGYDQLYARQVTALVKPDDWVLGLTTSGRSPNVRAGLAQAAQIGAYTLALTGQAGLAEPIDALTEIRASSSATCTIQEVHLTLLHHWCRMLE